MSASPHEGLMPFAFEDSLVRCRQDEHGETWFVVKDVCNVLGIEKYRDALATLDDDEKGCPVIVDTLGGPQEMSTVSESGLYALIFRSRKSEARAFRKWVTGEVLPALRQTGRYGVTASAPGIDLEAIATLPASTKKAVLIAATRELGELSRTYKNMAAGFAGQVLSLASAFAQESTEPKEPEAARLFWQQWERLNKDGRLNHSRNPDLVALHLPEAAAAAQAQGLPFTLTELRKTLPQGRLFRFLGSGRAINSVHTGKTVRCMVFYTPPPEEAPKATQEVRS